MARGGGAAAGAAARAATAAESAAVAASRVRSGLDPDIAPFADPANKVYKAGTPWEPVNDHPKARALGGDPDETVLRGRAENAVKGQREGELSQYLKDLERMELSPDKVEKMKQAELPGLARDVHPASTSPRDLERLQSDTGQKLRPKYDWEW
jgi:hypothetical protein